jgi:hypothetical protein
LDSPLFYFSEIITKSGIELERCRLLRHDQRGLSAWNLGHKNFGGFISYQKRTPSPFFRATYAFHFVPGPVLTGGDQSALFVGATKVLDRFNVGPGESRQPLLHHSSTDEEGADWYDGTEGFDLEWLPAFEDFSSRVLIRWGSSSSTRAWSQWANLKEKEIVELRRTISEPGFPGFSNLLLNLDQIPTLPQTWKSVLSSVGGVYLLTCPETGNQYIGSAYGEGGFFSRWNAYAIDGHGGNILLQKHGRRNYAISTLELASPNMSVSEIIARENFWKIRLGSRSHGLNAN